MINKSILMFACLCCTTYLYSAPQIEPDSVDEIQILSQDLKLISKTRDKETLDFTLGAMKRSSSAGSNTYGLHMDHYLVLIGPDSKTTRWYIDMASGHFARETPPKLVILKFREADLKKLREKLKAEPVLPANPLQHQTSAVLLHGIVPAELTRPMLSSRAVGDR